MNDSASFGRWLKLRRVALDLTQSELGELVGCSAMTIRKIGADERRPSRQLAERLAQHLAIASEDRTTFLKAARAELCPDRLASPIQPHDPAPARQLDNLPAALTPFVGRERELASISSQLLRAGVRLLTLTGPGGVGKTRLGLQVAAQMRGAFADGVWFVALAPIQAPDLLISTIAQVLGIKEVGGEPLINRLKDVLRDKHMLLVLDNFEHLLAAVGLLGDILHYAPEVHILTTSRERLNLREEWVVEVAGLQVPDGDQAEGGADYSAVALFLQCARRVEAGFTLSAVEQRAVVQICRLVEGMPLGIELAAAWVRALSCGEIADAIAGGLGLLTTSLRNVDERHRSLRAAFVHSWRFLSAEEQWVFRRLSVFQGGFGREAAEQVAGATLALLVALIDKSLLRHTANGRYDMHELLRQYAAEQLQAAGETAPTRERHLAFYLALAETAGPELRGAQQEQWFDRLEADHDNLRAALEWSRAEASNRVGLLQLASALVEFWVRRAYLNEGRSWLEAALAHADTSVPVPIRAKTLYAAGCIAMSTGHFATAGEMLQRSAALWRTLGAEGRRGLALALGTLVWAVREQGQPAAALVVAEESIALFRAQGERWGLAAVLGEQAMAFRELEEFGLAEAAIADSIARWKELGDRWGLSSALHAAALIAFRQADYAAAGALFAESLSIIQELGDKRAIANSLFNLGRVALNQENYTQAQALFDETIDRFGHIGDMGGMALSVYYQALMAHLQGDNAQAKLFFEQATALSREAGPKWIGPVSLLGLASVAAAQGKAWQAARLCGAAEAGIAAVSTYLDSVECAYYNRLVATALGELGQQAFDEAYAQGHALTLDQAIVEALGEDA